MPELLLNRIQRSFDALELKPENKYAVAYSGGPDSTFLLAVLKKLGFKEIYAIYVNYHDSPFVAEEESIVRKNVHNFGYHLVQADVRPPLSKADGNFEAKARIIRYSFFKDVQKKINFLAILTAHQEDDYLVTYLMQKTRGGLVTTWGIASKTKLYGTMNVLRPLLDVSKEEIIGYLKYNNIPYYDDETNKNLSRTRNWFRETVLPSIDREKTKEEIEKLNQELSKRKEIIASAKQFPTPYVSYQAMPEDIKMFLLYSLIKDQAPLGAEERKIIAARNLCYQNLKGIGTTEATELPLGLCLFRNYDDFYIVSQLIQIPYSRKIERKGFYDFKEFSIDLSNLSLFNLKEDSFPINIRTARPDDVFGTDIINNSVLSFLKSHKVPMYLRRFYPVIEDKDGKIVCVPFFEDIKNKTLPLVLKGYLL
ncbi:MAG: tRNA lysidine(34) synthetase TilS [Bacilli bacterium]|jgi:tRNA(Ile)-lysidine synthase|nr:tRNA lysidine(34) synthetase TilS [Bacilli bacterium]